MTETLLAAVPAWGPWLVAAATFLSCLALPIPSSLIMLAAGGFAAAGDLAPASVAAAALAGAVLGDQAGYWAARGGAAARLARRPAAAAALARMRDALDRSGGLAVFLSRWLFSALGPWANLAAGAAGMGWVRFTLPAILGEAVWVALYVGAGYAFGGNLSAATGFAGSLIGALSAGAVTVALGAALVRLARDA